MRSRHTALSALLVVLLVLAGCGGDDGSPGASTADSPGDDREQAGADAAFPVTIEHKYGQTTIDAAPQRIVALGATDHDPLLALGVTPVAVVNWRGSAARAWNEDRLGGTQPVELADPAETINFEQIAATDPDVIVALWSGITESDYETLSAIAPTVAQSGDYPDWGSPWQVNTLVAGQVVGRVDEAEALIADVEAQVADARAAHPELSGATVTIAADFADGNIYVTPPDDARYVLLEGLGMDTAPDGLAGVETLSMEEVDRLNAADVVFWLTLPDATIDSEPLYLAQPVHTEGRDIFPEPGSVLGLALTYGTVLSIPYVLEYLTPMLVAAVDGDPSTAVPAG